MKPTAILKPGFDLSAFEPYTIHCEACCGLCCVALYFSKTEGFPEDKQAGVPCRNLLPDYRCRIHAELSGHGLKGCMAYDCFGAGQLVTSHLKERPDWKHPSPEQAETVFRAYLTVMQVHQVLWYLTAASTLLVSIPDTEQINGLLAEGAKLAGRPLEELPYLDVDAYRDRANRLLKAISLKARSTAPTRNAPVTGKNFLGKNMRKKALAGTDFSMALMIASDLEGADLAGANFLGADLRDANLKNTDLSQALFLTQIQINAAKGNQNTRLPAYLHQPISWETQS